MKGVRVSEDEVIKTAKKIAELLDDKKAGDIILMDLRKINSYLDFFIIATANSGIHCRTLARELQKYSRDAGISERSKPNLDTAWIVLDYNEIVVHIFTSEMREYYQLEKLWADADKIAF